MKAIKVILLFTLLACVGVGYAEDLSKKGVGAQFGTASGNGYSYRWIGETHGIQFTLGAITYGSNDVKFPYYLYDEDIDNPGAHATYTRTGRKNSMSAGLNYIHVLDTSRHSRFYLTIGGSVLLSNEKQFTRTYDATNTGYTSYELDTSVPMTSEKVKKTKWTAGAGPGFEVILDRHFRFSIDLPFTYNSDEEMVMYIPQVGLYYYFK